MVINPSLQMYLTIALYSNGSLMLLTPIVMVGDNLDAAVEFEGTVMADFPLKDAIVRKNANGIVRYRLPVGWSYLSAALTALEKQNFSVISQSAVSASEDNDIVALYTLHSSSA
jgi:hypothetical protein